jgi:nucleoid DNA-binding protein
MKSIQTVNKLVSRELGYDENEVEKVNDFFWKEVKKKLSNFENTSVSIKHLGTFTVSKRKLDQFIKTCIRKIRSIRKSTRYKESTRELLLNTNKNKLEKALFHRNKLAKQYYEAYAKRSKRIFSVDANNSIKLGQST